MIHESVDLKKVVCDELHHVKSGSDSAICVIRFFFAIVRNEFKAINHESVDLKGVVCD